MILPLSITAGGCGLTSLSRCLGIVGPVPPRTESTGSAGLPTISGTDVTKVLCPHGQDPGYPTSKGSTVRSSRITASVLVACALAASACGSRLTRGQILAQNVVTGGRAGSGGVTRGPGRREGAGPGGVDGETARTVPSGCGVSVAVQEAGVPGVTPETLDVTVTRVLALELAGTGTTLGETITEPTVCASSPGSRRSPGAGSGPPCRCSPSRGQLGRSGSYCGSSGCSTVVEYGALGNVVGGERWQDRSRRSA